MPPGPAFNFFCILSSVADIITHAARIRAAQTVTRASGGPIITTERKQPRTSSRANVDVTKTYETDLAPASSDPASKRKTIPSNIGLQDSNFSATADALVETPKSHEHVSEVPLLVSAESLNQTKFPPGAKICEVADAKVISTQEVSSQINIGYDRSSSIRLHRECNLCYSSSCSSTLVSLF
jgi:aarF domain-containing kinase